MFHTVQSNGVLLSARIDNSDSTALPLLKAGVTAAKFAPATALVATGVSTPSDSVAREEPVETDEAGRPEDIPDDERRGSVKMNGAFASSAAPVGVGVKWEALAGAVRRDPIPPLKWVKGEAKTALPHH